VTPPGWTRTTLGALGRYVNGRGFKKQEWATSGRPIVRIQNLTGPSAQYNYYQGQDVPDDQVARAGDLLISWAATLGAYIWNGPEAVINQHIFKVDSLINRRFHKYLLDHKLAALMRETHGSGMVHITRGRFESIPVDLPPPNEQRRIVEILEDHLSRLDAASDLLRSAAARWDALWRSAVEGEVTGHRVNGIRDSPCLTAEGVDDGELPSLPAGWSWMRLGDVADVVGGVTKDAKKQGDPTYIEVPYLRVANVQRGRLNLDEVTSIRVPTSTAGKLRLVPGDVLLNEGGDRDKLGRGWVWEGQIDDCIHQNHVFRARVRDGAIDPYLLSWAANSIGGRWCERNGRQSVNLASISLSKIKLMPIPIPPQRDQSSIVVRLRTLVDAGTKLRNDLNDAAARGDSLRRSLLRAAFSGQLTHAAPVIQELAHV
jgi:type I restriction enzyme S subunit